MQRHGNRATRPRPWLRKLYVKFTKKDRARVAKHGPMLMDKKVSPRTGKVTVRGTQK